MFKSIFEDYNEAVRQGHIKKCGFDTDKMTYTQKQDHYKGCKVDITNQTK